MAKQLTRDEAFDMMARPGGGKRPAKKKAAVKSAPESASRATQMDSGGRFQKILQSGHETAPDERN